MHSVKARQCICVIVCPNMEGAAILDEKIHELIQKCQTPSETGEDVPVIFAASRRRLGRALSKSIGVSAIGGFLVPASFPFCILSFLMHSSNIVYTPFPGIFSADGAHETFKAALNQAKKLTQTWHAITDKERTLGRPDICALCKCSLTDHIRLDCRVCGASYCVRCEQKGPKKCRAGVVDKEVCKLVKTARVPPESQLSASASVFVPKGFV